MPNDQDRTSIFSVREGRYTNCFQVGHNAFEFVLEFGQSYSDHEGEMLHTRLVTSPVFAARFARLLLDAIEQYERTFGPIPKDEDMR